MNPNNTNIDMGLVNSLSNIEPGVKYAVGYGIPGLMGKYFIMLLISLLILLIVHNLKEEYKWQRLGFYTLIFIINISYFLEYYKIFYISLILLVILILLASWRFIKDTYVDIQLQKVQNIKFKNLSSIIGENKRKYTSIKEALSEDWNLALKLLIQYLDREYGELYKLYLFITFIIFINIILIFYYLYNIYFGTEYFIK